ncbi:MAG TPA: DUF1801 domain-containing protein [Candidatus Thermoplasmatota archaeon]|nr:DUF1801 domain-containing protein [Candidatus Thermoplasmatota archaeon]
MAKAAFTDVDGYIASFAPEVQAVLRKVREAIRRAVPEAEERIGYQMPAYRLHGPLLYFAAFRDHYSVFGAGPVAGLREAFPQLARYTGGKGTLRFPFDEAVPVRLIQAIARHRAKENLQRHRETAKPKTASKKARPQKPPTA